MATALIDPTIAGKYPVVLGDGILGKTSNEIFTGIRYNHKPELSSPNAPDHARLKPSVPGKTSSYDLTYTADDESYAFAGPRSTQDDEYVLYFDANRQAFVLDKVDSTFHMNVTRMPGYSDADELSRRFPHLEVEGPTKDCIKVKAPLPKGKASAAATSSDASKPATTQAKRKVEKKAAAKQLALPVVAPEESKPRSKSKPSKQNEEEEEEDDEDEDDDDGGLLIEYPEGPRTTAARKNDFSPAFPAQQRFDDYMNKRESGADDADDADGESDDETDMDMRLPSPVNQQSFGPGGDEEEEEEAEEAQSAEDEAEDDGGMGDLEGDLEKAMEMAFEDIANSQEEGRDDESEISEED